MRNQELEFDNEDYYYDSNEVIVDTDLLDEITEVEFENIETFTFSVHKKVTIWEIETHKIEAKSYEEAKKLLLRDIKSNESEYFESSVLDETTIEEIDPVNNNGMSTIEVYNENKELIYENS